MSNLKLLLDLHLDGERQGPGGEAETDLAIELAKLASGRHLRIADLGCGTGAAALQLAERLGADIVAVDLLPEFIEALKARADARGVSKRLQTRVGSIDNLDFATAELDAIWSEGAIYNIGFEQGVRYWRQFLKPDGILAVSEITWLTGERPQRIDDYWKAIYPEIDTASSKIRVLENAGYTPLGYFALPKHCWLENYYGPLEGRFEGFLEAHSGSDDARAVVEAEREEIVIYKEFNGYFSYGFYIARKCP